MNSNPAASGSKATLKLRSPPSPPRKLVIPKHKLVYLPGKSFIHNWGTRFEKARHIWQIRLELNTWIRTRTHTYGRAVIRTNAEGVRERPPSRRHRQLELPNPCSYHTLTARRRPKYEVQISIIYRSSADIIGTWKDEKISENGSPVRFSRLFRVRITFDGADLGPIEEVVGMSSA